MPWELPHLLQPDFVREGLSRLDPLNHVASALAPDPVQSFARVATLESSLYMRNQLLRDTDWASMAHSLEVRVPLVDRELLQRVAPITCGIPSARGKELLASNMAAVLVDRRRARKKTGFSTPIAMWLDNEATLPTPSHKTSGSHWSRRWLCTLPERFGLGALRTSSEARTYRACHSTDIQGRPKATSNFQDPRNLTTNGPCPPPSGSTSQTVT